MVPGQLHAGCAACRLCCQLLVFIGVYLLAVERSCLVRASDCTRSNFIPAAGAERRAVCTEQPPAPS